MIPILLVDDHPSVMEGTRMILEQEGDIKVSLANSADKAMEMINAQAYDVMLIDLHIGDVNGIDLAKQVLKMKPDAIILIYTGFEFNNHFNLMIEAGICGFILKTSNSEQLVTAVRCALRGEVVLPMSLVKQLRKSALHASGTKDGQHATLAIRIRSMKYLERSPEGEAIRILPRAC